MAWLRVDDGLAEHPKLLELSRPDRWTYVELLCWCARQGKDGTIPDGISSSLRHVTQAFLRRLEAAGLVDVDGETRRVHDWAHYNPKDPTKAERMARYRAKRVDGPVDKDVDGSAVYGDGASRAATRTRPVPSYSSLSLQEGSNAPTPERENDDLDLEPTDRLLNAWRAYAATVPGVRSVEALAQHGYRTGEQPPTVATRTEPRPPDPTKVCPDCGETHGAGHLETCPRLARSAK